MNSPTVMAILIILTASIMLILDISIIFNTVPSILFGSVEHFVHLPYAMVKV